MLVAAAQQQKVFVDEKEFKKSSRRRHSSSEMYWCMAHKPGKGAPCSESCRHHDISTALY